MEILNYDDIQDIYIEVLMLGWKIKIINNQWVMMSDSNIVWTLKDERWSSEWQSEE